MTVIWHDLECGSYAEDLPLWRSLAAQARGPVLDVGAGTGRVTLDLARRGHELVALDRDAELLAELERRARGLPVQTVLADARAFALRRRFALCLMPMQTIQLLGGSAARGQFLRCAGDHLEPGGVLAIAIAETLDLYEVHDGAISPLPDICERDGVVYSSQPTAVRSDRDGFVLERRRETIALDGHRSVDEDRIRLDHLSVEQLEREGARAGFAVGTPRSVAASDDYVGSEVVILHAG